VGEVVCSSSRLLRRGMSRVVKSDLLGLGDLSLLPPGGDGSGLALEPPIAAISAESETLTLGYV